MGYLLKEALKTMCGVNQWSYAVFWKFGCRNPNLLIWEECYHEPVRCCLPLQTSGVAATEVPLGEWEGCLVTPDIHLSKPEKQAEDRIQLLIIGMIARNQINIVGEGIVGRAAFTGNHQWILSSTYNGEAHPPKVLNELLHQFSAGIQTVAVIPVASHGVVQLGSSLHLMESVRFVNEVRSLILQLGSVPNALLSDPPIAKTGEPVSLAMPCRGLSNNGKFVRADMNCSFRSPGHANRLSISMAKHVQDNPATTLLGFQGSEQARSFVESYGLVGTGVVGAETVPITSDVELDQHTGLCSRWTGLDHQSGFSQSGTNNSSITSMRKHKSSESTAHNLVSESIASKHFVNSLSRADGGMGADARKVSQTFSSFCGSNGISGDLREMLIPSSVNDMPMPIFTNVEGPRVGEIESLNFEGIPSSSLTDHVTTRANQVPSQGSKDNLKDVTGGRIELPSGQQKMESAPICLNSLDKFVPLKELIPQRVDGFEKHNTASINTVEASCLSSSGDDLFDVLGRDFRNKMLGDNFSRVAGGGSAAGTQEMGMEPSSMKKQDADLEICTSSEGLSESGVFLGACCGGGDLLDAVVTKAPKTFSTDTLSCKTTLTKISSSIPSSPPTYSHSSVRHASMLEQLLGESFDSSEHLKKGGTSVAPCFLSGHDKEETCSPSSSMCKSQISSWVEQSHAMKLENSVSTAYSRRPDEMVKSNRKRLKPGENPRPRPKDRQMIQDRLKELRDIVPSGAKCSIDALLERTIKHMLFLQSVTKHADKLKQTGESKIVGKKGGLVLRDNFEGGSTWAFEVGSESMVCPIIVEDLNPPRQMLVEMLCKEGDFFLEIADNIRGLGLTILKGVMEARNDKIWAQFAVEANKDVTRMEIFMSLVHLLEDTAEGSWPRGNAMESNQMVNSSLAHVTSIPAAGLSSSLQ